MIRITRDADRHSADHGWLKAHWHFSFADYHDPSNLQWGPLRVFNDDVIGPGGGFPPHPHRDMEIVTLVTAGALEHRDDLGHVGVTRAGEVQVMSAGRGIEHAEYNASKTEPVRLMQLWLLPRTKNLPPRWEQKAFDPAAQQGRLLPVVSSGKIPGTLPIDQDAVIYLSRLTYGQAVTHEAAPGRKAYLFVIAGAIELNGQPLAAGDQARIEGERQLSIDATADTHLVLLDLP